MARTKEEKKIDANEDEMLDEFGIKIGEKVGVSYEEEFDLPNYKLELSELDDEEHYSGKPILSNPNSFTYMDKFTGKEETRHNILLWLVDKDEDEYLEIKIPLKEEGFIQKNIHPNSKLFPLIKGVTDMEYGEGKLLTEHYTLETCNLQGIIKKCNEFPKMTIKVIEKTGKINYNTFVVIKPE